MKKNILAVMILSLFLVGVCSILARQMLYQAQMVIVPVAHNVASIAVPQTTVYILSFSTRNHEWAQRDVRVSVQQVGKSDAVRITVYGAHIRDVVEAMRNILAAAERDVQAVYGADVRFSVLHADRTVQKRMIVAAAPYGAMIAGATALIMATLWFFDQYGQRRAQRPVPQSPWEARRIFASVHAPSVRDTHGVPSHSTSEQVHGDGYDSSRDDVAHQSTTQRQKDATLPEEQGSTPSLGHRDIESVVTSAAPVHLPSGLQTTPGNLPVVDVTTLGIAHATQKTPHVNDDPTASAPSSTEPTEEELKARLNALLSGNLS